MNTARETEDDVTVGTSIVCIVASLSMILLTSQFRSLIDRHRHLYLVTEVRYPPFLTQNTLDLGPYLWVAAAAASIWGFRLLITRPRSVALSWFLWSFLLTLLALSLMSWALVMPLDRKLVGLSP